MHTNVYALLSACCLTTERGRIAAHTSHCFCNARTGLNSYVIILFFICINYIIIFNSLSFCFLWLCIGWERGEVGGRGGGREGRWEGGEVGGRGGGREGRWEGGEVGGRGGGRAGCA